jgi:hypothetical protein
MLNTQTAQQALTAHANANTISAQTIQVLLANKSTTFANVCYVTPVATSAKHKHVSIKKVVSANVQLFSNISAFTNVYANAVQKSANNIEANNADNVANFTTQSNYFTHTNVYSIVKHKQTNALYLYAIFNNASSMYFINNEPATKEQVAQYLTASASAKLLAQSAVTHNVANNVLHTVKVRTIALANLVSITANKQTVSVASTL